MSGEMNRRRSSFSERIQRVFGHENGGTRRARDEDYIGPRRLSFSEQIQQVFHREKPEDLDPGCAGRTGGSRRSSLSLSEHVQRVFHHDKPTRVRFSLDLDDKGPPRRSENVQRMFRYQRSARASLAPDPDGGGRDVNMGPTRKPPRTPGQRQQRVACQTSGLAKEAGTPAKTKGPLSPPSLRLSYTAPPISSTPSTSPIPSNQPKQLSFQNVTQDLGEGSFQTWPGSPRYQAGGESSQRASENGNANKKEKRAVRRLEHERKAMEESFKRFDEKARNDAFKHEQAKLAHEAARKDESEKRKELVHCELHETVGAEKRQDVTKPVEAAKTKEDAKTKKALKALTVMKTLKVTKEQTAVNQQNFINEQNAVKQNVVKQNVVKQNVVKQNVVNEQHDANNIQSSQEDAAKEPTKNVQSPVSSDLETPKRSPNKLTKKQPLSPLNKPATARTSSDSGHSSPITIPTRTSSRFASTGFTSLFSSETERTSRSTSVSTTDPPANPADPAGECPTEEARAPSCPCSAVAAAAEEGEEVYFTAEE